ncbi:MAG: family 16 glycosylhydrolase [Rikenellaceae bacterium]
MKRENLPIFLFALSLSLLACTSEAPSIAFSASYPEGYEPASADDPSGSSIHNVTPTTNPDLFEAWDDFTEDFGANGATSWDTSKWAAYDDNTFAAWTFYDDNVTIGSDADGENPEGGEYLRVTTKYDYHTRTNSSFQFCFSSGILRSLQPVTYGYYEARIKGSDVWPGTCSAFWLYSIVDKESIMPREEGTIVYNEIDIIELQQIASKQNSMASNIHLMYLADSGTVDGNGDMILENTWAKASSMPTLAQTHYDVEWYADDDFHIYGCENRPDSIVFYLDNVRVGGKKNSYWHMDEGMYITFSQGLRTPFENYGDDGGTRQPTATTEEEAIAAGFPTSMYVDYIRSYRRKGDHDYSAFRNNEKAFDVNDVY